MPWLKVILSEKCRINPSRDRSQSMPLKSVGFLQICTRIGRTIIVVKHGEEKPVWPLWPVVFTVWPAINRVLRQSPSASNTTAPMPMCSKDSEFHLERWRFSPGKQTPPVLHFSSWFGLFYLRWLKGKFMLRILPISFEEDDLYVVSFNRTENVAFVEPIMRICAKMQIYYNF